MAPRYFQVANIGPATYNYDETISTLRYANRAKNIQNVVRINEDPKDALLRKFQEEIEQLRKQLENEGNLPIWLHSHSWTIQSINVLDEGSADSGEDDEANFEGGERKTYSHWDEKINQMEIDIAERRKQLANERGMAESERRRLAEELIQKESELKNNKTEHDRLMNKLASIERKLIIGGENMLEKAEKQAQLLEQSNMYVSCNASKNVLILANSKTLEGTNPISADALKPGKLKGWI